MKGLIFMVRGLLCFDTYDEMINYDELRDGMVILTLGEHAINDGNGSLYYVTFKTNTSENLTEGTSKDFQSPFKFVNINSNYTKSLDDKINTNHNSVMSLLQSISMNMSRGE